MDAKKKRGFRPVGCGAVVVLVLAAVVGVGVWFGRRDREAQTPCERYTTELLIALDHCHSGLTRNRADHVKTCEETIDPSPACRARISKLSCEELDSGLVASAPDVCARRRSDPF